MAGRLLALCSRVRTIPRIPFGSAGIHDHERAIIGNREIVGFGMNGAPTYIDQVDFPFPAIRWKEPGPEINSLREKEKGDWKKMTIEEKKALYRASFCQTFAEMNAPTGEWKRTWTGAFMIITVAFWFFMYMRVFVYPPLPSSFSEEARRAQLRRMLDLHVNPVEGISSKWDYEKNTWKK